MHLLEAMGINVHYGEFLVLRELSLEVNLHEVLSVVGANTAGKTTLLNVISGVVPLSGGDIRFQSESIKWLASHEIARLGIIHVPEGRRIFPFMSVFDNLLVGSSLKEARMKRRESLEYVFSLFPVLKEREKQSGGTLSGGEQQMLAIARGLMALPKLLMLDEPSIGLAPIAVESIFNTIKQIQEQGITIFLVEQNVQKSLSLATRGYVLEGGSIRLQGTGEELLTNPYVKEAYLGL